MAKNSKTVTSSARSKSKKTTVEVPPPPAAQTGISFRQAAGGLLVLSIALLGISGWFWWSGVVMNSDRAFNDMLSRSLQTDSVTRQVAQNNAQGSVDQLVRLDLSPTPTAQTVTKVKQPGPKGPSLVTTETIGTQQQDYIRYRSISSPSVANADDVKKVVGTWGTREAGTAPATFFDEAVIGLVPFGNLNSADRQAIRKLQNNQNVYSYTKVDRARQNGRPVFIYKVSIGPQALIASLAEYSKLTGLGDSSQLDPKDKAYANMPPLKVDMTVDALSRQLTRIKYSDSARAENYSGTGLKTPITKPSQTIPIAELQKRLQSLQQPR